MEPTLPPQIIENSEQLQTLYKKEQGKAILSKIGYATGGVFAALGTLAFGALTLAAVAAPAALYMHFNVFGQGGSARFLSVWVGIFSQVPMLIVTVPLGFVTTMLAMGTFISITNAIETNGKKSVVEKFHSKKIVFIDSKLEAEMLYSCRRNLRIPILFPSLQEYYGALRTSFVEGVISGHYPLSLDKQVKVLRKDNSWLKQDKDLYERYAAYLKEQEGIALSTKSDPVSTDYWLLKTVSVG